MAQKATKKNKKEQRGEGAKNRNVRKTDDTNKVVGVIAAVAAMVMVVVTIIAVAVNSGGPGEDYFVSDGSKYVFTMEDDEIGVHEDEEHAPVRVYSVYDYKGDTVTGMRVYYEYENNGEARAAYDYAMRLDDEGSYKSASVQGKYLVSEMEEYNFEGLTVEDLKRMAELRENDVYGEDWGEGWHEVIDDWGQKNEESGDGKVVERSNEPVRGQE